MRRMLPLLVMLLAGQTTVADQPVVFRMPKDKTVCFRNYFYTGSEYLQFNTNGTYRKITREHMFVEESDHGTWKQDESGDMALVSREHYRNIECAPLSIFMWHTQAIERLPWVTTQVQNLIANSTNQLFTKEQIEGIEKYGYKNCLSRISVDSLKLVPRERLADLTKHIEQFLNDPARSHFHATPLSSWGHTFLVWKDSQTQVNRDWRLIKRLIDMEESKAPPAHIFTRIDTETFEKESGKTQEFIFHPEMNKCVPQSEGNDTKASNHGTEPSR